MLSSDISLSTSISPIDVTAVLECFLEFIPKLPADGKTVQLGDFGTFRASRGEDTPEDVNRSSIKGAHLLFVPSVELKSRMAQVKFRKEAGTVGSAEGEITEEEQLP